MLIKPTLPFLKPPLSTVKTQHFFAAFSRHFIWEWLLDSTIHWFGEIGKSEAMVFTNKIWGKSDFMETMEFLPWNFMDIWWLSEIRSPSNQSNEPPEGHGGQHGSQRHDDHLEELRVRGASTQEKPAGWCLSSLAFSWCVHNSNDYGI